MATNLGYLTYPHRSTTPKHKERGRARCGVRPLSFINKALYGRYQRTTRTLQVFSPAAVFTLSMYIPP